MLRGDDDTIGRQCGDTLGVQVVIGDDVVRHADGGQELVDVVVRHPARRARSTFDRIHQRKLSWPGIQHRTELRDQRHAGPIAVMIVAGQPELRVHVRRLWQRSPCSGALGDFRASAGADIAAIDLVAERRHQQHHIRLRLARPNDERNEVLAGFVADMRCIETARPVDGNAETGAVTPPERALVIVMEMDRAVLVRSGLPIVHRTGPVRSRHRACRQVDQPRVRRMGSGIDRNLSWNADGEVPCRQRGIRWCRAANGRTLKLAVVVRARRFVAFGRQRGQEDFRLTGWCGRYFRVRLASIAERCMRHLLHHHRAIDAKLRGHVVPSPFQQRSRHFRAHCWCTIRSGNFRHRAAIRANAQRERPVADAQRDQALPTIPRPCRPDRRRQRNPTPQIHRQRCDMAEAAQPGTLFLARMHAVDRARHCDFRVTRSSRIGISANVTDKPQAELPISSARDHEANRLALLDAPAIGVTGQRMHQLMPSSRRRTARSNPRGRSGSPSSPCDTQPSAPGCAQGTTARCP